jgi:hypothetical protein
MPTLSAEADQKIFGSMPCPMIDLCLNTHGFLTTPDLAHSMVSKDETTS